MSHVLDSSLLKSLAQAKQFPTEFLASLGIHETARGIEIPYRDEDGKAGRTRIRTALGGDHRFLWAEGDAPVLPYGLWKLKEGRSEGFLILVEGESDCWTLWQHGFPALGLPGASMTGKLEVTHLQDIGELYVIHEGDSGGEIFAAGILERLQAVRYRGRARIFRFLDTFDCKDPSDLHVQNPETFPQLIQDAIDKLRGTPPDHDGAAESSTIQIEPKQRLSEAG